MDVYELVEKLGGEICLNRARVRIGGEIIVVGVLNGNDMIFTEEGSRILAEQTAWVAAEEPKARRVRQAKVAAVESEQVTSPVGDLFDTPEQGLT